MLDNLRKKPKRIKLRIKYAQGLGSPGNYNFQCLESLDVPYSIHLLSILS